LDRGSAGKRLELLREIAPGLRHLAILANVSYVATALRAEGFHKHDHHRGRIDGKVRQLWVREPSRRLIKLSADQIRERYLLELNGSTMG
jgi:hypothetical protein